MTFENLLLDRDGAVARLTINRPQVLNALNSSTTDQLRRALLEVQHDKAIRVLIITGAGPKAFVAGADINELAVLSPVEGKEHALQGQQLFDLVENLGKPVIAAINGYALGGGCELAMACTLRIAASSARLGQPEINLGIIPGYGGSQRLARLVGNGVALDLLLTGRQVDADEALRIGLVNRVVAPEQLAQAAQTWAAELAALPTVAVGYMKQNLNTALRGSLGNVLDAEAPNMIRTFETQDHKGAALAFVEKRAPQFKGC